MPFDPTILLLVIFAGFVLWWMPRNARKQQAAAMAFRNNLQPGQEVLTIGRMYGTVVEVDESRVTLELSDGVYGVWDKEGIMRLVDPPVADDVEELTDDELADDELDDDVEDDALEADDELLTGDELQVPDDASSLTNPDEDKKNPR